MRFDWHHFCVRHQIPFVTSGPNVAKNNIAIRCPWCGTADPSHHMGLSRNINNPVWGCFRNAAHRGRNPVRIIAKLLGVTDKAAQDIVGVSEASVDDFANTVEALRHPKEAEAPAARQVLKPPIEFRNLGEDAENHYEQRFLHYLAQRGYGKDAGKAARLYHLWYAITGDYAWRIIFPVTNEMGHLIGWTGRDIRHNAPLRYKTANGMGKDIMLSFRPPGRRALAICEGPFDAMKLDYFGRPYGLQAMAVMGTAYTDAQVAALLKLAKETRRIWIVFDRDAIAQGLHLAEDLTAIDARWIALPHNYSDPGEMSAKDADEFCKQLGISP